MPVSIVPYTEDLVPLVKEFNQRLAAGGVAPEFRFPEQSTPAWLPKVDGRRIYQEYYLARDGEAVRGGFILKFQEFRVKNEVRSLVYYHLPVSEGIVRKAYASVGAQMVLSAVKREPMLFGLGMGGFDRPLPRMLKAMGWSLSAVPFHFKVNHPARFLREIAPLRQGAARRRLADLAAWSGAGWLLLKAAQRARTWERARGVRVENVNRFDAWADQVWERCRDRYAMIACRDAATLDVLYPPGPSVLRFKVERGSQVLGWAVARDTRMRGSKYFGDLRVGSIVDALALPEDAPAVIAATTRVLEERGVDLVVSNQGHRAWCDAIGRAGFLEGPSNFIFAASTALSGLLEPFDVNRNELFLNRGDGDGPVNL